MKLTDEPGKFWRASDIEEAGPQLLTVAAATRETMDDGKTKAVVWFKEDERGLVLNKTRKHSLTTMFGTLETDDMVGQKLVLEVTPTTYKGQPCMGMAIRLPKGSEPPSGPTGDDTPF